jgi:hypothetical protein
VPRGLGFISRKVDQLPRLILMMDYRYRTQHRNRTHSQRQWASIYLSTLIGRGHSGGVKNWQRHTAIHPFAMNGRPARSSAPMCFGAGDWSGAYPHGILTRFPPRPSSPRVGDAASGLWTRVNPCRRVHVPVLTACE